MIKKVELTIIIVNYRVKYFLEQTLRSVAEATCGLQAQVVVVDNASGDDSLSFSRDRFPDYTYIENSENVGFARANNQGIALAEGEYTLILNPDTVVTAQALTHSIAWLREHPDCGAVGVHMLDGNGVFLPESKRSFPTMWVSFCKIFGLSSLFPRSRWFAKYHLRYLAEDEPHKVDILSGAYMMCRTDVLKRLGGLDEDFFMYGEDIDLSYRSVKEGFTNWYVPVDIIHYKGESTKKDSMRYVRVFYNAMLIFYRKHFPRVGKVLYPVIKLGVAVRASLAMFKRVCKRVLKPFTSKPAPSKPWVIMSAESVAVSLATGLNHYTRAIPESGECNVLIDDATYSYAQIVEMIATNARKGVDFHIYSSRNRKVISPKMQA